MGTLTTKEITVKKTATSAEETFAQTGSWASSLSMNFKDENWEENLADDYVSVLGSTLRVDVGWSIYESPLAEKLNWYLSGCDVQSLLEDGEIDTENTIFSFKTFSFNAQAEKKQQVSCEVAFCLVEDECDLITQETITCDNEAIFSWKKSSEI